MSTENFNSSNMLLAALLDLPKLTTKVVITFEPNQFPQVQVTSLVEPIQIVNNEVLKKFTNFELVEKKNEL